MFNNLCFLSTFYLSISVRDLGESTCGEIERGFEKATEKRDKELSCSFTSFIYVRTITVIDYSQKFFKLTFENSCI